MHGLGTDWKSTCNPHTRGVGGILNDGNEGVSGELVFVDEEIDRWDDPAII